MPFSSERQRRFMHAKHPEIAQRWEREAKKKGSKAVKKVWVDYLDDVEKWDPRQRRAPDGRFAGGGAARHVGGEYDPGTANSQRMSGMLSEHVRRGGDPNDPKFLARVNATREARAYQAHVQNKPKR